MSTGSTSGAAVGMIGAAAGATVAGAARKEVERWNVETLCTGCTLHRGQVADMLARIAATGELVMEHGEGLGDGAQEVAEAAGKGCAATCSELFDQFREWYSRSPFDFVLFDLVRDCWQIVGLVLSALAFSDSLDGVQNFFAPLSNLISLNLPFVVPSLSGDAYFYALVSVSVVFILLSAWLWSAVGSDDPNAVRDGHELKTWSERQGKFTLLIKVLLTALTSLYLPILQLSVSVLVCGEDFKDSIDVSSCDDFEYYNAAIAFSVLCIVMIGIGLPIKVYMLIQKNKPVGSLEDPDRRYNDDGELVPYTTEMYATDLQSAQQQACPYQFLYEGYERAWAFYKVVIMVMKAVLVVLLITSQSLKPVQLILSTIVLTGIAAASFYTRPFIDHERDVMDQIGRSSAAWTALLATIGYFASTDAVDSAFGVLVNLVLSLTTLFTMLFVAYEVDAVRIRVQRCMCWLTFSSELHEQKGSPFTMIRLWGDEVQEEAVRRIYQCFWDGMLAVHVPSVMLRLNELKLLAQEKGLARIRKHFDLGHDDDVAALRAKISLELEGLDVYYDDQGSLVRGKGFGLMNRSKTSDTHFGKLYVTDFPFTCTFVSDDTAEHAFIHSAEALSALWDANQTDSVVQARRVRLQLRALHSQRVTFHFERDETRQVADGEETYTDSSGNKQTRTVYSTITVHMTYNSGVLAVHQNDQQNKWSAGFDPTLRLDDGHGSTTAPRTGRHVEFRNMVASLPAAEFGITHTFDEALARPLFEQNMRIIAERVPVVEQEIREYRAGLAENSESKQKVMSNGFWLFCYRGETQPREAIEAFLRSEETNEELRSIPDERQADLDMLYTRLDWVRSSRAAAVFYCFWEDVFSNNTGLPFLSEHGDDFDPAKPESLPYRLLQRAELEEFLATRGAAMRYFKPALLDLLYEAMCESE